jgi:hypothetical protein
MKKIVILAIIFQSVYFCSNAQTFLLLDRKWSKKAVLVDSVTRENLSQGWYPIYKEDLDSLILLVDKLKNLKDDGMKRKFYYSEDFKTSNIEFVIENIKRTYGDGYEINLISSGPFGKTTFKLADSRELLNVNQKTVRAFLAYLERTKKNLDKLIVDKGKIN